MKGSELEKIMDAIEGSKIILNRLVSFCEDDLSKEETLRASRELDELLNIYNSLTLKGMDNSGEISGFFENENLFVE